MPVAFSLVYQADHTKMHILELVIDARTDCLTFRNVTLANVFLSCGHRKIAITVILMPFNSTAPIGTGYAWSMRYIQLSLGERWASTMVYRLHKSQRLTGGHYVQFRRGEKQITAWMLKTLSVRVVPPHLNPGVVNWLVLPFPASFSFFLAFSFSAKMLTASLTVGLRAQIRRLVPR